MLIDLDGSIGYHERLLGLLLAANKEELDKEIENHILWEVHRERAVEGRMDGAVSLGDAAPPRTAAMEAKPP